MAPDKDTVNRIKGKSASIIDIAMWLLITQPFLRLKAERARTTARRMNLGSDEAVMVRTFHRLAELARGDAAANPVNPPAGTFCHASVAL